MIDSIDIRTALLFVCIVNISFAVGLTLLQSDRVWDGARYWFAGNVFGLGSAVFRLSFDAGWKSPVESILPATLMILTNLLKIAALVRKRQRTRVALVGIAIISIQLILALIENTADQVNVVMGVTGIFLSALLAWQAYICYSDLRWQKMRGCRLFVISSASMAAFSLFAALRGFHVKSGHVIFSETGPAQANLMLALMYIIISHICLIAMLMDRLNRVVVVGQLRQRKESRQARQAEEHAIEMARVAQDKQSLLEVLIHEVRQPLNNAQAALQNEILTFDIGGRDYEGGRRIQAVIDKVVLSLSNAIVAASVVERKSQSHLVATDLVSVCELACSDTGLDWKLRIDLDCKEEFVLAEADPILLRLAVRNLVDNAIRHSASGRKVQVVLRKAGRYEALLSVANWPTEPFKADPNLFVRGHHGVRSALTGGKGLGLYISNEIALLHNGSLRAYCNQAGQTEFLLTLPLSALKSDEPNRWA